MENTQNEYHVKLKFEILSTYSYGYKFLLTSLITKLSLYLSKMRLVIIIKNNNNLKKQILCQISRVRHQTPRSLQTLKELHNNSPMTVLSSRELASVDKF